MSYDQYHLEIDTPSKTAFIAPYICNSNNNQLMAALPLENIKVLQIQNASLLGETAWFLDKKKKSKKKNKVKKCCKSYKKKEGKMCKDCPKLDKIKKNLSC
jgi:hypothetical protein